MLSVVICEDDAAQAAELERRLEPLLGGAPHRTERFAGAQGLLGALEAGARWDLALMDIALGEAEANGIDLARRINRRLPGCRIIFITGYVRFVSDVYRTEHLYFVLKSELDVYLPRAVRKALDSFAQSGGTLRVRRKGGEIALSQEDILYLERELRTTQIVLDGSRVATYDGLGPLLERLPSPPFVRCHHSFIVNLERVREQRRTELLLDGGALVPVSRRYLDAVRAAFARYLGQTL